MHSGLKENGGIPTVRGLRLLGCYHVGLQALGLGLGSGLFEAQSTANSCGCC